MPDNRWEHARGRYPYATEMFGAYRPMIGWRSRRKAQRLALLRGLSPALTSLLSTYESGNVFRPDDGRLETSDVGRRSPIRHPGAGLGGGDGFFLTQLRRAVAERLAEGAPSQTGSDWSALIDEDLVRRAYGDFDGGAVRDWTTWQDTVLAAEPAQEGESEETRRTRHRELAAGVLDGDSRLAAAVLDLSRRGAADVLRSILPATRSDADTDAGLDALARRMRDPFAELDPKSGLRDVGLSPLGIVHYFRQYFFELDTFLGPAVGHVWLAPGSTVELVESSTRRHLTERTTEFEEERTLTQSSETSTTDEISGAVHSENRSDSKLGFTTTVNQSWPLGDMSATASMNLDRTQQEARETTHKRMRQQTEKVSTELRRRYATTFKTVSEVTDTSSRRYVISNPSETELQNYELRRKMRRVAVQVQDVGTYLCWETFVQDPGAQLGLGNLLHIAKSPEVAPVPPATIIPIPDPKPGVPFDVRVFWEGKEHPIRTWDPHGISFGLRDLMIDIPDGWEVALAPGTPFQLTCVSVRSDDPDGFESFTYTAVFRGGRSIEVYLAMRPGASIEWDHHIQIDLRGTVTLQITEARAKDIRDANVEAVKDQDAAAAVAQQKADEAAFYAAAKERIELAAAVTPRRFEDLREEERSVVYRKLIASLLGVGDLTEAGDTDSRRHVYATVIDAIFDVNRMLYFVAPEWWRPRRYAYQSLGSGADRFPITSDRTVRWDNGIAREDDYLITGESRPARLGSSLGWVLQLDGDDQRNRFLNAPWVRAVMPVRPGKEEAALNWLRRADVEGSTSLDHDHTGSDAELTEIRDGLAAEGLPCADPPSIADAIRYLCVRVTAKHAESTVERLFPDRDGLDDDDKVWATPLDKVFEHGFDPLERSFRANPLEGPADGTSTNFQVMAQWTEVVPTDQVVPVPVTYDPVTGRQRPPVDA